MQFTHFSFVNPTLYFYSIETIPALNPFSKAEQRHRGVRASPAGLSTFSAMGAYPRVETCVNGSILCTDSVSPYSCNWSVPGGKAGKSYQIQAKAFDATTNVGSSAIVTVMSQ